jgi:thiamine-monophosphate kinase
MNEFDIIERYFKQCTMPRKDVVTGIGDDAAILQLPDACSLVASTDTLVKGTHFRGDVSAYDIGYKSLAVNLSDMAAMAAEPLWVTLSLTLPENNESWISEFSRGFCELAKIYNVALVGGDISRGPLAITVQILGAVPHGGGVKRDGARPGDNIYVTGHLGMASFALSLLMAEDPDSGAPPEDCLLRLNRPEPRINIGLAMRGFVSAAIDISDGLAGDLGHLLEASSVGAEINLNAIPVATAMKDLTVDEIRSFCLNRGDDYELCFTADQKQHESVAKISREYACEISRIGKITASKQLIWLTASGDRVELTADGYRHF